MNHTFVKALRAVFVAVMMSLTGNHALAQVTVHGNVYGGGNLADVKTNTLVNMSAGTVAGNVFGGGKGDSNNFTCDKAMVGKEEDDNKCEDPGSVDNKDKGTKVIITNGTVGTLDGNGKLVEGTGNVYGGGEIGRVEWNTQVTIGEEGASGNGVAPDIKGSVFGAGKGLETHGYSALVRGNSTVIVQGKAKVRENVYGGGEMATVGRYWVKNIPTTKCEGESEPEPPGDLPNGMPYQQRKGGICRVTIQGNAQIGPDSGGTEDAGHVFGAGKGVDPHYSEGESKRMTQEYGMQIFTNDDELHKTAEELYYEFLQTLALVTNSYVTIDGSAAVKGSVYGGSMSGFVQHNTEVNILGGEIGTDNTYGDVFGGGLGLKEFAEAGKVKGNTKVDITGGNVQGNVYGGGSLGDVGIIDKTDQTDYNYLWKKSDGSTANDTEINKKTDLNTNTGICKVSISGGTIGVPSPADATKQGNVFGAGRGSDITWWCEKAISYAASVTVTGGIVNGNVYGGGQIGRVEDDAKVTIGTANETGNSKPTITGSVFGAGAGLHTHGYSALVRGNTDVTVQGAALVGGSVYGGGETASVGKFRVDKGLPKEPLSGGYCTVTIQDNAKIGLSGTEHNVYGACKGVDPTTISAGERKSMQLVKNKPEGAKGTTWDDYEDADGNQDDRFIWRIYSEAEYPTFVRTLALTSHPHVTIAEDATVNGSVYGGGQRGITLGNVDVDITGGTVYQDVYGGGALADTNAGNWDADGFTEVTGLTEASSVTGLYERSGAGTSDSPYKYTITEDVTANSGKIYYSKGKWANASLMTGYYKTTVNLMGGLIKGDAYGGGLGQKNGFNGKTSDIAAVVHGDIRVNLGSNGSSATSFLTSYYTDEGHTNVVKSGRVFGCNNLMGSPEGSVTVDVWKTVAGKDGTDATINRTPETKKKLKEGDVGYVAHTYEVAAVYGGGNLADFTTVGKKANVIIETCDVSVQSVYGGGNAAEVSGTDVLVKGAYEIQEVFGGGNGKDPYTTDGGTSWTLNGGANIGNSTNPGNANTLLTGGLIHAAYGGSNEKGTIYGNVQIDVGTGGECTLDVEKMVGAGKNADVNGSLIMILGCKPSEKIPVLYAGADQANVNGNVELTITSGNYGEVYGGNNLSGAIRGHIKLNIEETGDCETPITIDNLYLGGNQAAYSVYGYYVKTKTDVVDRKKILKGDPNDPEEIAVMSTNGKLILLPRESASDPHMPVKSYEYDEDQEKWTWEVYPGAYNEEEKKWYWTVSGEEKDVLYVQPEMNIISCTRIDEVFGGGYGSTAIMYCDPVVNINMIQGSKHSGVPAVMGTLHLPETDNTNELGIIGDVYGGGDAAAVYGNTTVNIGTAENVLVKSWNYDPETKEYTAEQKTVLGAYIRGNVYGGGKLANVGEMDANIDNITAEGHTFVNIGAKKTTVNNQEVWQAVAAGKSVTIKGNVYGGGKGEATTFKCEKAIVAGATNIMIGNGTVNGTVYGGGHLGRVETGTTVTIGIGDGVDTGIPTSEPQINGDVYGAGAGVNTHGYAALVRGISEVTIQGNAKVGCSVYGGGQIASVGRYKVKKGQGEPSDAPNDVEIGMPYTLADSESKCIVTVKGYAEIGPDNMQMKAEGGPDDTGYVFGAGKGVLPYEGYEANENPVRWTIDDDGNYVKEEYEPENEDLYLKYVGTLALATETEVTIGGHAFVKGSVYGGSENGHVQHDTNVKIEGNCQIGNGWNTTTNTGVNERYNEALFVNPATATAQQIKEAAESIYECAHWDYTNPYTPYDKNGAVGGGAFTATDGHTFYGNVFGGGSGYYPYKSRLKKDNDDNYIFEWLRTAGRVVGNTNVIITGGHILTSVYGGCELTDVGNGVSVESNKGKCFVKMSGGTLGVPRTLAQIAAHPVTCYLFGAGKGDQRVHFNQWTNVGKVRVEINDSISQPIIYGSVFGGGEDGHVLGNVSIDIKKKNSNDPVIGTWGTSYVDGNVFGGGRGFGGDALTAGVVSGNVNINISGGKMLGSIYGGGRLGSVGTYLVPSGKTNKYGYLIPDGKQQTINEVTIGNGDVDVSDATGVTHGHVTINISGGTIGNDYEFKYVPTNVTTEDLTAWKNTNHVPNTSYETTSKTTGETTTYTHRLKHTKGGNVFAGAMGRLYGLDGSTVLPHWLDLGKVKSTKLTVSGSAIIKSSIYGGGELGWTSGTHKTSDNKDVSTEISITGGIIGSEIIDNNVVQYTYGSVFGGGYGSDIEVLTDANSNKTYPKFQAGRVMNSTAVNMSGGTVKASVYGGGELANVGYGFYSFSNDDYGIGETAITQASDAANTYVTVSGGIIGKAPTIAQTGNTYFGGATMGNVYGGGSGSNDVSRCGLVLGNTNVNISGTDTRIYHNVYGGGAYGSVGDYEYETETVQEETRVKDPNALHTTGTGTANVTITGGIVGYDGKDNGMVFGSSRGDVQGENSRDDYMAWVYDANVTIGTSSQGTTFTTPLVKGSVYGSGENGHVFHDTDVKIYSGTIGIDNADTSVEGYTVISGGTTYKGPEYTSRGNVYGGGCGTDTYTKNGKEYFNPIAGIVKGNTNVTMTGGHVVRSVYGGGSMGSVGTFTDDENGKPISCVEAAEAVPATDTTPAVPAVEGTGLCTVTISGGKIGPTTMAMPNYYGNVFGAGRGEVHDPAVYPNLETSAYFNKTEVKINGTAFVKGSVYGGSESGHVLGDTHVTIDGDCQIGCGYDKTFNNGEGKEPGKDLDRVYNSQEWAYDVTSDNTKFLYECNSWPFTEPYTPYDKFADDNGKYPNGENADNAHQKGTDGHTFYGNVFGGGSGSTPYAPGKWLPTAGWVEGNTTVEIKGGHILTSVYGGNEMSDVGAGGVRKMTDLDNETADMFYDITKSGGKCTVKMSGGTLGVPRTLAQIAAHPLTCYLFGAGKGDQRIFFNKTTNVKEVEIEISGGRIYGSVFGGGEDGHVMKDVKMTIKDNAYIGTWGTSYVDGNVFGGGRGFSGEALTAGNVGGIVNIDIQGGTMLGSVYGGGRLGSVGYGLYLVNEQIGEEEAYGILRNDNVDDRGNSVDNFKRGYITINISGGTIGNDIEYKYNPTDADKLKMPSTQFDYQNHLTYTRGGNVFTGCMGRLYALDNSTLLPLWTKLGRCKQTELNITGGTIKSNVYGGAELGVVQENATVNITGGTVGTKVVDSNDETNYYYYGSVFGSGKGSNDAITYPEGTAEAYKKDISEAGTVEGNVTVELNKGVAESENKKGGVVRKIFGCNDMNGTPKGTVTVHVYATQKEDGATINDKAAKAATAEDGTYDVEAVYGGGNLAAYVPTKAVSGSDAEKELARPEVIIDGCGLTSIGTVYGGGNAASVPATNVTVNGTYEIGTVFGGGNGKDAMDDGSENPGADVGYKSGATDNKVPYGTGIALAELRGGTIHKAFGGSNTKGNVRASATVDLNEPDPNTCPLCIEEVYGAGNEADQDGSSNINLGCISYLSEIYGGAKNADINNNIDLTIQSGRFNRVFGGNNLGGSISGTITVNIEETGCHPIVIGQLFGGGNQAAYTAPTGQHGPTVNVKSFTSIGEIYGGGYGNTARVTGDTYVNINESKGKYADRTATEDFTDEDGNAVIENDVRVKVSENTGKWIHFVAGKNQDNSDKISTVWQPEHRQGAIGTIGNVFGGGNEAGVVGNTNINIGDMEYVEITTNIVAGETDVRDCYIRTGEGTEGSPYVYSEVSVKAVANTTYYRLVVGEGDTENYEPIDNNGIVVGTTDVSDYYTLSGDGSVGSPYVYHKVSTAQAGTTYYKKVLGVNITGNVYGGGNAADVTGDTNVFIGQ